MKIDMGINFKRVIVLGSKGFIGNSILKSLKNDNIPVEGISREQVDLLSDNAESSLELILKPEDYLVIACANAPVKNNQMLLDNIKMMKNIINAILTTSIRNILYVSSDAIYSDNKESITEDSPKEPKNLHGIMHLTREIMLEQLDQVNLSIVRPTLVYGFNDPHNGYGPNQFVRLARDNKDITLFGKGEELRDHINIEDVTKIIVQILIKGLNGHFNIATGQVISFNYVANQVRNIFNPNIKVLEKPRIGPMPHGGYRSFDITKIKNSFPSLKITNIDEGLKNYFLINK